MGERTFYLVECLNSTKVSAYELKHTLPSGEQHVPNAHILNTFAYVLVYSEKGWEKESVGKVCMYWSTIL